ncbi:unnamed protein product [Timema podura]|uniref:Uncharacterized protein n=1 Tax=Timema podura TaxID=61482 RepID=A0ABN7P989_TIMPD|nr:unnamed protein product [Timema podura]
MNAGRPCEDMVQYKVCNKPCDTFQWFTGGWSECQLIGADQERGCGTGDQYRQVRCMQLQPHELPTEVSDMFCDPIVQPADVNACHVACPGDCVLGRWSDWSECYKVSYKKKAGCLLTGFQRRSALKSSECMCTQRTQMKA